MYRQNDEEEDFWRTRPNVILAGKIQGFTSPLTTDISQLLPRRGPTADRHITPLRKFHPAQRQSIESSVAPHTNRRHESRREDDDDVVAVARRFIRETRERRRWTERIEKENIHQRHRCEWHSHSSHLRKEERRLLAPQLHHSAPLALSSYLLCLPLGPKLEFLSGSDSRKTR